MINLESVISDALALSAIPAPTGQEEERGRAVAALLEQVVGLEVCRDAAGNVLARLRGTEPNVEARSPVVVTAHLDTVFGPEVDVRPRRERGADGETVYGPGIGDNAIALATLPALARELAANPPPRDVVLAATVGEEGLGNLRGVRAVLRDAPARCVIALEGHRIDRITSRAVGSTRLGVTYNTSGGHSWEDRGAPSAVHALAQAAARVVREVRAEVPECAVNVGVFEGGISVNTIASRAALQLDLRSISPAALERGVELARAIYNAVAAEHGVAVEIAEIGRRPAGVLADEHPLILAAQRARREVGLEPAQLMDGSTDANAAFEAGVPGISIGITRGAGAHRLDEHIDTAPVVQGIAAALGTIRLAARLETW